VDIKKTAMTIKIYNTLTGKKEIFEPIKPGKISMYVCGPTVYDHSHIGHARSVVVFDVIARYLRAKGFNVIYVRNFTDIDDKIINRANELGMDSREIADKYIKQFHNDMDALNIERATVEPKATDNIDSIISLIEKLIKKDFAYSVKGNVYFSVESFDGYGKLSGRKLEDMEAGARVKIDPKKRSPFDFALWKAAKPKEPFWESPWGKGRPGWHIECSAMSTKFLGQTIDIHGGGKDLIFPHHENEIAQSEAAFGKPFANYWIHNGFVNINQEKMSKSLGNFLMIKDVIKQYHPETVRFFLLSSHYRSPIDFTDKAMDEAGTALDRIYTLIERIEKNIADHDNIAKKSEKEISGGVWELFCEAMDDDFNSARGLGILFDTVHNLNRMLDKYKTDLPDDKAKFIRKTYKDILKAGSILGILLEPPEEYFAKKRLLGIEKKSPTSSIQINTEVIDKMIQDRADARKSKDWGLADKIRKDLEGMNILLEDRPEGTVWKVV